MIQKFNSGMFWLVRDRFRKISGCNKCLNIMPVLVVFPFVFSKKVPKADIINSLHSIIDELAETFSVHKAAVERWIDGIELIIKLDQWVPHQHTAREREERIRTCISLLFHNCEGTFF